MQEAMRVFPGLAPKDSLTLNDQAHTPLSLQTAAAGIKALYEDMLDRAWADARARGEKLPPPAQKASLRRCRGSSEALRLPVVVMGRGTQPGRRSRSRTTSRRPSSRAG